VPVEELRDLRILERLLLHHVAPVTGRVSDAEKDGAVELPGRGKGLRPPGVPVHGVVGVLLKVGARLEEQAVGVERPALPRSVARAGYVVVTLAGERAADAIGELWRERVGSRQWIRHNRGAHGQDRKNRHRDPADEQAPDLHSQSERVARDSSILLRI
jgi:hypothetical protein